MRQNDLSNAPKREPMRPRRTKAAGRLWDGKRFNKPGRTRRQKGGM